MFIELGNIHTDWRNIYIGKTQHTLKKGMDGDLSFFQFLKMYKTQTRSLPITSYWNMKN